VDVGELGRHVVGRWDMERKVVVGRLLVRLELERPKLVGGDLER
jgi:hypothetical protein